MSHNEQAPQTTAKEAELTVLFEEAVIAIKGILEAVRYLNGSFRSQIWQLDGKPVAQGLTKWLQINIAPQRVEYAVRERVDADELTYCVERGHGGTLEQWKLNTVAVTAAYSGFGDVKPISADQYPLLIETLPARFAAVLNNPALIVFPPRAPERVVKPPGELL